VFHRTFGCVRLVWNKTLADRHAAFFQRGERTSCRQSDAALTAWKKTDELAFLSEVSCVPLQQTLRHQHTAFGNFFAGRARYPRFKSRTGRQSAHYTRSAFRIKDGALHVAKTDGPLRIAFIAAADMIVLEDLAVANMLRNRKLSRVISDAGWAEFRGLLEYKATRAGRHLIVIDRWYPSSKTCSHCKHLLPDLDLGTRHWTCPACRTRHDRDVNAAKNILAAERAVAGRESPFLQEGEEVKKALCASAG
jgi:IS605 OrfB family transposase